MSSSYSQVGQKSDSSLGLCCGVRGACWPSAVILSISFCLTGLSFSAYSLTNGSIFVGFFVFGLPRHFQVAGFFSSKSQDCMRQ